MKISKKTIKNVSAGAIVISGLSGLVEPIRTFLGNSIFGIKLNIILSVSLVIIGAYLIKQNNL